MKPFADIERDYIRSRIIPDFDFESFDDPSHVNPLPATIAKATVALIVTAGAYIAGEQQPFRRRKEGDPSYREFPGDIDLARIALSHVG